MLFKHMLLVLIYNLLMNVYVSNNLLLTHKIPVGNTFLNYLISNVLNSLIKFNVNKIE
jgi:hypothetical protein